MPTTTYIIRLHRQDGEVEEIEQTTEEIAREIYNTFRNDDYYLAVELITYDYVNRVETILERSF